MPPSLSLFFIQRDLFKAQNLLLARAGSAVTPEAAAAASEAAAAAEEASTLYPPTELAKVYEKIKRQYRGPTYSPLKSNQTERVERRTSTSSNQGQRQQQQTTKVEDSSPPSPPTSTSSPTSVGDGQHVASASTTTTSSSHHTSLDDQGDCLATKEGLNECRKIQLALSNGLNICNDHVSM